jgi:simple sugar transport system ATP-binding protein
VVLGREPRRRGLLDRKEAGARVRAVAEQFGFDIDPEARVEQIGVGMQQRVEIVKALYRGAELLILDEPTANLTPQEADDLYRVVRGLAQAGKTVVFISHKLREVLGVAGRIGVMRRGKLVTVVRSAETSTNALSELMVGREVVGMARAPSRATPGEPLARLQGVSAVNDRGRPALTDVSLELRAGEILAVAAWTGTARPSSPRCSPGCAAPAPGTVTVAGRDLTRADRAPSRGRGLARASDRQQRGLCLGMRVDENLALGATTARPSPGARSSTGPGAPRGGEAWRRVRRAPRRPVAGGARLSGGNQQKVIVAREVDAAPEGAGGGAAHARPRRRRHLHRPRPPAQGARRGQGGAARLARPRRGPRAGRPDLRALRRAG